MDPTEIARLMRKIRENGHEMAYMPQTREELDEHGCSGAAERALGQMPVVPYDEAKGRVLACVVILPGEMLTMPDNRVRPCAWGCGRMVQHRPWVPPTVQPVCLYCCAERPKEDS